MSVNQVMVITPALNGVTNSEWLDECKRSLPRGVKQVVCWNDGDLHQALNDAVCAADTEFVFRLDADDCLYPDALEMMVGLAENADVVYPTLVLVDENLSPFEVIKAPPFCPNRLMLENFIPGCSLVRREAALRAGGYRDLEILEDWDLWVRMNDQRVVFKPCPEAHVAYRQHGASRNKAADPAGTLERMRTLIIGNRTPVVRATWYAQDSPATTYWRCQLPARPLGQVLDMALPKIVGDDDEPDLVFPQQQGAAVWQFPGSQVHGVYMSVMQEQGVPVLIEVDDNYTIGVPGGSQAWVARRGRHGQHSYEYHTKLAGWCDGVIVSTPHLYKVYRKLNNNVFICPNQVDPEDWVEPVWSEKEPRVGWSASASHKTDIRLVRRALEWASSRVQVEMLGLNPMFTFRYRHIPWTNDLDAHRRLQHRLTIGVCPLVENPWSVSKSDVKVLEYAMAGVCPVYSDAIPYADIPEDIGFRVKDAKGFYHVIKHLVDHPEEAREAAEHARAWVLKERTVERNTWRWEEALDGALAATSDPSESGTGQERGELEPVLQTVGNGDQLDVD